MSAPLLRLPPEIWVEVAAVLVELVGVQACTPLARLSCLSRRTNELVESYGWNVFLRSYPVARTLVPPTLPTSATGPSSRSKSRSMGPREQAAESYRCRRAWDRMEMSVARTVLSRGTHRVSDPLLLLATEAVLVFVHSRVYVRPLGLGLNRARGLGSIYFDLVPSGSGGKTGPLQNFTSACLLDASGSRVLLSRIDGSLEEYQLPMELARLSKKKRKAQALEASRTLVPAPPVGDRPSVRRMMRQPAQALSYADGLLACLSRTGRISLWSCGESWTKLWEVDLKVQAWTCLLDAGHRWLVVGAKGAESLLLFPLAADLTLQAPMVLSTLHYPNAGKAVAYEARVGEGKLSSVFAVAQHKDLLVAGFYDGVVRVYDLNLVPWMELRSTSAMLSAAEQWPVPVYPVVDAGSTPSTGTSTGTGTGTGTGTPSDDTLDRGTRWVPALTPSMHFRDRFDDSAVYAVALGTDHILAGMSTSGIVKMYPLSSPAPSASLAQLSESSPASLVVRTRVGSRESVTLTTALPPGSSAGRTVYAGYPSRSPVFALVADWDRMVGVTDTQLFDVAVGAGPESRSAPGPVPTPARQRGPTPSHRAPSAKSASSRRPLPPRPRSPDYLAQKPQPAEDDGGDVLPYLAFESVAIAYA